MNRDEVISTLNDLIETSKDGEYGFRACAEKADSGERVVFFSRRADECRKAAAELQLYVMELGGAPHDSGTVLGGLHRGWVSVRTVLATYDDPALIEECERGEDHAVAKYRKALDQPLPDALRLIVERQYQGVCINHDQTRRLRDTVA